jgi:hypothetical protein
MKFGLYTAESPTTCGGYPASANHESLDAETFADWGIGELACAVGKPFVMPLSYCVTMLDNS